MDSLFPALAAVLVVSSGLAFVAGAPRPGVRLLLLAAFAVAGGEIVAQTSLAELAARVGLPPAAGERALRYALYVVGLLVLLNLVRHFLALFVGYSAASSAVGGVLASVLLSILAIVFRPVRQLRRLFVPRWD